MRALSTRKDVHEGVLTISRRYRLEIQGVRVAIESERTLWEEGPCFRVDFWTPRTRWKEGAKEKWAKPIEAFALISEEIGKLYLEALDRGDTLVIEAACSRRLSIYRRLALKALKQRPLARMEPIEERPGALPGFLIFV